MKSIARTILNLFPQGKQHFLNIEKLTEENNHLKDLIDHSRSPALFENIDDFLTERLLSHPAILPKVQVELDSQKATWNEQRVEIAARLQAAYKKSKADYVNSAIKQKNEDLWTKLIDDELPDLLDHIENRSARELAEFLLNFGDGFVWYGGLTTSIDGYNRDLRKEHIALTYWDMLVSVAEYIGVLPIESPESGPWGSNLQADVDGLIAQIEDKLKISITPPGRVIYTDGLATKSGLLHYRHLLGVYGAIRVHQLIDEGACCEIGGGLGFTAMYARRLGVTNYTLFDLPMTCLLAGNYLMQAIRPDQVSLYGEKASDDKIKILPFWELELQNNKQYMLTVNQDSFPEIAENILNDYLSIIPKITSKYFLSINHECFHPKTVSHLVAAHNEYQLITRAKCWLREGYIEELYQLST